MKVIHYYPSVYSMFKQLLEKSLEGSSFVVTSTELDTFKKKKVEKVELNGLHKLQHLCKDIEDNLGNNILYVDPTVYINPARARDLYKYLLNFKDVDLCMAKHSKRNGYSPSVMKIKCTKKMLAFFKHVKDRVKKSKQVSEEPVINNVVKEWEGRIEFAELNSKFLVCPFISSEAVRQNFFAWTVWTKAEGLTSSEIYDNKVKIVFDHRFINREDYNYYKL